MKIQEFAKLPAKEANERLRAGLKEKKLTMKQFMEFAGAWLKAQGLIKTDCGWYTQEQINAQGLFFDQSSNQWLLEGEMTSVSRKNAFGKVVNSIDCLPIKAIAYDTENSKVERAYNGTGAVVTPEMAENILTDMENL